ncbi:MAG: hypothetical protein CME64_12155 [Halobacteriovoraceae bacterium]|nr:hypothetical protein [Halobacteriovoraceae bacterium]|tara:strand:- start:267929 stop:268492 length:564 start_codon:yes stop_codon:yes gene_type:complete
MKKLFSIFLIAGVCQAFGMNPERLFQMAINGQSEFGGRATSVLDRKMQNIHAFITLRENYVDDGYSATFASNGNKLQHKTNVLFPTVGDIYFSVYNEDGTPVSYKLRGRQFELVEREKIFYIIESDYEYEARLQRIKELNSSGRFRMKYPVTGKFMAIGHFEYNGPTKVDFFEITKEELIEIGTFRR